MYSEKDLANEIGELVGGLMDTKADIDPDWVTSEILASHNLPDDDFIHLCAHYKVRSAVRDFFGRFKLTKEKHLDKQITLPGFTYLQPWYPVDNGGKQTIKHIDTMSELELIAKETELEEMGKGCFAHKKELAQFRRMKFGGVAA